MRLIATKDNIKPDNEVKRLTCQIIGSKDTLFLAGDLNVPIFDEENK